MRNTFVFSTNINSDQRINRAACRLCKLRHIGRWSIDLTTRNCLLCIETDQPDPQTIIRALARTGLHCQLIDNRLPTDFIQ